MVASVLPLSCHFPCVRGATYVGQRRDEHSRQYDGATQHTPRRCAIGSTISAKAISRARRSPLPCQVQEPQRKTSDADNRRPGRRHGSADGHHQEKRDQQNEQ